MLQMYGEEMKRTIRPRSAAGLMARASGIGRVEPLAAEKPFRTFKFIRRLGRPSEIVKPFVGEEGFTNSGLRGTGLPSALAP